MLQRRFALIGHNHQFDELEGIFINAPANGDLLVYDSADVRWENRPPTSLSANPTASVGLSAVNGVAATFMRSDAAPALSQAITPTWTGAHRFNASLGIGVNPAVALHVTAAITQISKLDSSAITGPYVTFQRSGVSFGDIGNGGNLGTGYTLDALALDSRATPLQLGTGSTRRFEISLGGEIGINCVPVAGVPLRAQEAGFNDVGLEVVRSAATGILLRTFNRQASIYGDLEFNGVSGQAARVDRATGNMMFARQIDIAIAAPGGAPSLTVTSTAGNAARMELAGNGNVIGTSGALYGQDGSGVGYCWNRANQDLLFGTNNVQRGRFLAAGAFEVLGVVLGSAGAVGAPAYTFTGDTDTGMWANGANAVAFSTAGAQRAEIDLNGLTLLTGGLRVPNGSAAAPSMTFSGDLDNGAYRPSADIFAIATTGIRRVQFSSVGITSDVDGTAGLPSYHWTSDPDTGLFSAGVNALGFAAGGFEGARVDATATAGNTRFMVYDVDNATLERVTVGAADTGGAGFKVLRIPN